MSKNDKIALEIWNDLQDVPKADCSRMKRRLLEQVDKPVLKRFIQVLFELKERL